MDPFLGATSNQRLMPAAVAGTSTGGPFSSIDASEGATRVSRDLAAFQSSTMSFPSGVPEWSTVMLVAYLANLFPQADTAGRSATFQVDPDGHGSDSEDEDYDDDC